ncbi:MAG: hypothetical protein J6Y02_23450 [Pseudobutyrivibrio sp.]|nr:hypothetical protein [Pseudobutyrivibrio sp.]
MGLFSIYESDLTTKERNDLKPAQFGLPEDRKYPLIDAEHVRSAIKLFGHCPEGKRTQLAKNIHKAAKKFGVEIKKDNLVSEYLSESVVTESASNKKYGCPYCNKFDTRDKLVSHIEKKHDELLPTGYSASRIVFDVVNHKEVGNGYGTCRVCQGHTSWNEKNCKYNVICDNPACRKALRDRAKKNMIKVYGKPMLLDDPEHQQKMLANRSISGIYTFRDGGKITYTGSYEKKALEFFDQVLEVPSSDIMAPGPTLQYEFQGEKLYWITDIYYIPYNLIIEVKDGGDNPNQRDMPVYRGKQYAKEEMITSLGKFNYLRLTNNDFSQLLYIMAELKADMMDVSADPTKTKIQINESSAGAIAGALPPANQRTIYVVNYLKDNTFVDDSEWAIMASLTDDEALTFDRITQETSKVSVSDIGKNIQAIYSYTSNLPVNDMKKYIFEALISEDQLEFDSNFKLLDIDKYLEETQTEKESLFIEYRALSDPTKRGLPILDPLKYDKTVAISRESAGRFELLEDYNGFYVQDNEKHMRSKSYNSFQEAVDYYYEHNH